VTENPGLANPLAGSLRDAAVGMVALWRSETPPGDPTSPDGAYNLACLYASRHDLEGLAPPGSKQGADDETAVRLLEVAVLDDDLATWMTSDPQLAKFRTRTPFRRRFLPEPRTDFFGLPPVAPFATALKTSDYASVERLAALPETGAPLGPVMPLAPHARASVVGLAKLAQSLRPLPALASYRVEVLHALCDLGVTTPSQMAGLSRPAATAVRGAVVRAVNDRVRPPMGQDEAVRPGDLSAWWYSVV